MCQKHTMDNNTWLNLVKTSESQLLCCSLHYPNCRCIPLCICCVHQCICGNKRVLNYNSNTENWYEDTFILYQSWNQTWWHSTAHFIPTCRTNIMPLTKNLWKWWVVYNKCCRLVWLTQTQPWLNVRLTTVWKLANLIWNRCTWWNIFFPILFAFGHILHPLYMLNF